MPNKNLIHMSKHDMCEKFNSLLPEFFNDQQAIGFSQIVPCFFVVARTTVEKLRSYPPGQILVQEIILQCIRICNQLITGYNKIQTHVIHCPRPTSDSKYFMSSPCTLLFLLLTRCVLESGSPRSAGNVFF